MPIYEVQAIFASTSGLPEDQRVNVWHVDSADALLVANWMADLQSFYNDPPTGFANPPRYYFSPVLSGAVTFKAYNMSTPPPRLPEATLTWSFVPRTLIGGLPEEVACCLSYRKFPYTPLINPQSQRGRIYFGPLNPEAFEGYGGGDEWNTPPRPATAFKNILAAAASDLEDANGPNGTWVVYSRVLDQAFAITDGWIDNAFDTQRRRGVAATARTLWS